MKNTKITCNLENKIVDSLLPEIKISWNLRTLDLQQVKEIKLYLDNKRLFPKVDKNFFKFLPENELKIGKHKIKIKIQLSNGKKERYDFSFKVNTLDSPYNHYYGIPHCHTSISTGKGTPKEALTQAYDNALNFIIITDHYKGLKSNYSNNNSISNWDKLKDACFRFNKKHHDFLALYGYEIKGIVDNHINVLFSTELINNLKNLDRLKNLENIDKNIIVAINHPQKKISELKFNPSLNNTIRLLEVCNGSPPFKYKEYYNIYFKMLDHGWKLAPINSQDNHLKNWGNTDNLTVVLANRLSEKSFCNALKKRRTYSTESKSFKLEFIANDKWMGSTISPFNGDEVHIYIKACDKINKVTSIQLYSNNSKKIFDYSYNSNSVEINEKIKASSMDWFVVKVNLEGNLSALSSAIYVI
ncbi:CehA/McbA family metallohydrolase [Clostridium grantii]|uniref:Polymerase/histidinol phosphatase N-terminal domain-containing protein n=1 Tax=Clostridium grantii DSM 8605 TaxID=1121316 RepID=A0A1M5UM75_9CLOT|nr:CehA/McbA family metallohydrolase [Clostridium grantii]SHH64017.1 hypothetical protein SAMN02745207_01814 [Clostridium grantii DSM 8605]